ncbi:MAG: hypothetical protein IPG45_30790 [Deltaproteobacteria bacterium]|nr:hypothetical protein [Deltaproteobacteria bacterium]
MNTGRQQRKMTNLLLNRSFQLKYTGMVVGLSSVISIGLGFFLVEQMRENSRMLQLETNLDAVFQEQLVAADAKTILVMVGALIAFNVVLGLGVVFVTHRMAGPIFVFRRYLRVIGEGRIPQVRALRKGDEFGEVIEQLQLTVVALEERLKREIAGLERARSALVGQNSAEAQAEVERLLSEKRNAIEAPQSTDIPPQPGPT